MTFQNDDELSAAQPPAEIVSDIDVDHTGVDDAPAESGPPPQVGEQALMNHVSPAFTADHSSPEATAEEPQLFARFSQPEPPREVRIPHLGHLALLVVFLVMGWLAAVGAFAAGVHLHLFHVTSAEAAQNDIHFTLGTEAVLYGVTFVAALIGFPLVWNKGLFAGLQWHGETALRYFWRLIGIGFACYIVAILNQILIPSPTNMPIEKVFKQPGAAWLLFFFGITFAPFFEETFFRGFLLPSLCTAYDWLAERFYNKPRRPLLPDGHPQWSFSAMAIASVVTSIPFGLMHAPQTGNSVDAVILLVCVSIVLCIVRLKTRSLASCVLVHSFYNLLIFSMILLGTGGFRNLDKM
jgi:uncharacterized protein